MRNRAKCKLCHQVIESMFLLDYISCECGEIAISGGNLKLEAKAHDWDNFLRIDETGKEIPVSFVDLTAKIQQPTDKADTKINGDSTTYKNEKNKITRQDIRFSLEELIKTYESLPQAAFLSPVTQYDLLSVLYLVKSILNTLD
jgi:hypothetical protein